MPEKLQSHSQRQKTQTASKQTYDANIRARTPALKTAKNIRSSKRWQRLRQMKLNKSPMCEDPMRIHKDRYVLAKQVDHIIPLQNDASLAFHWDNIQSLCTHCHGVKTAIERRTEGRDS